MSSSQQMIRVPREWLSAYLENDAAMVYFDGERTSLWELLSNAVRAVQPEEQLQRESIDSPIDFLREENFLKLESEIERKERVIVHLRVQLSERSDPCNWSDQQVLEFLGVALRNVDLVGEIRLSEIRQGFEHMRPKPSSSEQNLENCGDEPKYRWPEELHTKVSQSQRSVTERDELKPCPFCGCQVTLLTGPEDIRISGAHGRSCPFLDLDVIVDGRGAWQARATLERRS